MTKTASQILEEIQASNMEDAGQLQPAVLFHQNIDIDKVEAWWSGHLNSYWAEKIDAKITEGYMTVHVQTEFQGIQSGHVTMIYMAKMRK